MHYYGNSSSHISHSSSKSISVWAPRHPWVLIIPRVQQTHTCSFLHFLIPPVVMLGICLVNRNLGMGVDLWPPPRTCHGSENTIWHVEVTPQPLYPSKAEAKGNLFLLLNPRWLRSQFLNRPLNYILMWDEFVYDYSYSLTIMHKSNIWGLILQCNIISLM